MPDVRSQILRAMEREARHISDPKAKQVFRRSVVQTGLVESGLSNPAGGDADSAGWRQERASLYPNPTNIAASMRRFRQEFQQHYTPGEKSYDVAARVQRPAAEYRGRYKDRAREAEGILKGLGAVAPASTSNPQSRPAAAESDNTDQRRQILAQYLLNRGQPNNLLATVAAVRGLENTSQPGPAATPTAPKRSGSGTGQTNIEQLLRVAAKDFGLTVREHPAFDPVDPVHTKGSYHYRKAKGSAGAAGDLSGPPDRMAAFAAYVSRNYGKDVEELIWRGSRPQTIKKGRRVPANTFTGHQTHVHVADSD